MRLDIKKLGVLVLGTFVVAVAATQESASKDYGAIVAERTAGLRSINSEQLLPRKNEDTVVHNLDDRDEFSIEARTPRKPKTSPKKTNTKKPTPATSSSPKTTAKTIKSNTVSLSKSTAQSSTVQKPTSKPTTSATNKPSTASKPTTTATNKSSSASKSSTTASGKNSSIRTSASTSASTSTTTSASTSASTSTTTSARTSASTRALCNAKKSTAKQSTASKLKPTASSSSPKQATSSSKPTHPRDFSNHLQRRAPIRLDASATYLADAVNRGTTIKVYWEGMMTVDNSLSDPSYPGYITSSAKYQPLGNEFFEMAVSGLFGCTTLIVVSQKGVYMSHWIETRAFEADEGEVGAPPVDFQREVLTPLSNGGRNQASLAQHAADLAHGHAYLMHPTYLGAALYPTQMNQIRETVTRIIPTINWHDAPYNADPKDGKTTNGKALVTYNPTQGKTQPHFLRVYIEDRKMEPVLRW